MDVVKQWTRIFFFAILGCTSINTGVDSFLTHNSMFSPTSVPPFHNIYVHPTMGPPMSTLSPILPTVTPLMPAARPAASSVYPRRFFKTAPRRRTTTTISVRPVNIQNAVRSPKGALYQVFSRLTPAGQTKLYRVLKNHMGPSLKLPTFGTPRPTQSSVTGNKKSASGQPFTMVSQTKDLITREVQQNAVLLQRLVGQNQIGSSTASRLGRQVRDMKQKLLESEPVTGQQKEQLVMQLRNQFRKQLSMFKEPGVSPAEISVHAPSRTELVSSNAITDVPHSLPHESIDQMFADIAAESGKSISFSSDIGPGTYKIEYDMLITQEDMEQKYRPKNDGTRVKRALLKNANAQWTGGRVPYTMRSRDFSSTERRDIHLALREWESYTCVNFVPAKHTDPFSLHIKDSDGCHSYVGMKRRQQMVGLAKPCRKRSIILHEIGHAIGMFHEQARPDRNSYIDILYDHILPPVRFNFQQIDPDQTTNYSIPYDYLSIMHYGETAFSYNRSAVTMRAKDPSFQKKMGKASRISFRDVMSVNAMYNCSGHCSFIPKCPFKEAFVGKDCRCWCPTEENDREPAKLCPDVPKVTPPRLVTTPPNSRGARPNQRQRDTNGVLLEIAFNPNGRRTSNRGASAVLTPVGRGHNFIRNPSNQGARMVPTSGNEGSQTLAATLSNLPESIRIGSLRGNGQRSTASRNRKTLSRNRSADRRPTFRRQSSTRSHRPSTATSATGDRLEQQLLNELNSLSEGNEGTTRPPSQPTPLLSGLVPSRSSSTDFNTMVSNVMGMLSGSRTGNSNRNTNGAVVSSQTPGGGVATAELKLLLQELNRLNSQNQMSPHIPIVSNVRHTHVRSRGRNADILSQRRAQNLLRELSDLMLSQSGRHQSLPLSREQISYLLQKVSSFNSPVTHVTHTHPVVIEPSAGHHHHHHHHHHQEHSHHHHREQTHHRREQTHHRNDVLSPIIENSHFHSNP